MAVALLHSFAFSAAKQAFSEVAAKDPSCAMAHWGIALTYWGNPFAGLKPVHLLAEGQKAIERGQALTGASPRERDYIAAVDWRAAEKAAAEGRGQMVDGMRVLNPREVPGIVYLMPCGKSPHGVDVSPDGKWIIGSGKLQGVTTVFNFEKIQTAIRNRDFTGDEDGIPVWLETTDPVNPPIYERFGFTYCGPFGDYVDDPNSLFMTKEL